jgi:PAS domain S-box-containing protein
MRVEDGSQNVSVSLANENDGAVEPHVAEGCRTLATTGGVEASQRFPLETEASRGSALLCENLADRLIVDRCSGGRASIAEPTFNSGQLARNDIARSVDPQQGQDLFRLAVETYPSGMIIADSIGAIVMVNRSVERMFGYGPGALLRRPVDILVPQRFRPLHVGRSEESYAETNSTNVGGSLFGQRTDGNEFPIEVTINPIDTGGDLLVLILVADISKQRDAEKHLEQMEARYRGLLEAAPDAMVVVNSSGEIVLLNIQAEKRFGYRRDELVGQNVTNIIPEGFAERLIADALRSREDALAQQIGAGIELSGLRKDGSAFPIEIMLSPLDSVEGFLVTVAIRDITTRKNMERLKDEFVATVSHELRTPLTSIAGALGLLIANAAGILPDSAARLVTIAYANSQRLVRLINDILDVEKLEARVRAGRLQAPATGCSLVGRTRDRGQSRIR